jgi:hypothetical protein
MWSLKLTTGSQGMERVGLAGGAILRGTGQFHKTENILISGMTIG